jgi:hypothetical protein
MPQNVTASHLANEQIELAYPHIQAMRTDLSLDQWAGFARAMVDEAPRALDCGIITARGEQDYIQGLFSYVIAPDLHHGRSLLADNFIALDMRTNSVVASVLIRAMCGLARESGCATIHAIVPDEHAALFEAHGVYPIQEHGREGGGRPARRARTLLVPQSAG